MSRRTCSDIRSPRSPPTWVIPKPTIAALIGHKGHSITSRYVHSADAVLLAAADAVADRTAELMGEKKPEAEAVVPLRATR